MNSFYFRSILTVALICSSQIESQEISESDLGFNGQLLELDDLSCLDSFNQKAMIKRQSMGKEYDPFKKGKNIRGKSLFYFGEGLASIDAQPEDPLYIDSIQNAIALAGLRAKKELALFRSSEVTKETVNRAMEAISSGIPVSDYGKRQDALDDREKDYNDAGLDEKLYRFLDQKLDEWIGEREAIAEDRAQLEKELENVVSQNVFGEIITTLAYSEIAGMKNIQIQVKKDNVCVLSVWSQRTKRWANELGELNYQALAKLRPGKKTYQSQIPTKKTSEGLRALTASYGLHIDVDPDGEIYFISYGQAGAMDRSANSVNNARMIAENRARGQIASFQNEAVDIYENLENITISTDYTDGTSNKYSERNFVSRAKSSATLNIAGIEQFDWWASIHPYTKKPVVGVILVWQPTNALILESDTENDDYDDLSF
jgi:hypothetical protein